MFERFPDHRNRNLEALEERVQTAVPLSFSCRGIFVELGSSGNCSMLMFLSLPAATLPPNGAPQNSDASSYCRLEELATFLPLVARKPTHISLRAYPPLPFRAHTLIQPPCREPQLQTPLGEKNVARPGSQNSPRPPCRGRSSGGGHRPVSSDLSLKPTSSSSRGLSLWRERTALPGRTCRSAAARVAPSRRAAVGDRRRDARDTCRSSSPVSDGIDLVADKWGQH